jgi:hypothetical protein
MKNLFDTPSWQAGRVRLADHAEVLALRPPHLRTSSGDLIASLARSEDEDEDRFERPVSEAFEELADRKIHLGEAAHFYPFDIDQESIALRKDFLRKDEHFLYLFLLLATKLNMRDDRKHARLDGAVLFEFLSCEAAKRYWGATKSAHKGDVRVKGLVFGTARFNWQENHEALDENSFEAAVNGLCLVLREGRAFRRKDEAPTRAQDDKLDVVVWREFSDQKPGKLIGFGQCKTGTNWGSELPRLNPLSFCQRWLDTTPAVTPIKIFFLTDRLANTPYHFGYEGGVIFDRCRILDYADSIPSKLLADCARWTKAVLRKSKLVY